MTEIRRGSIVWTELDPTRGREKLGRRAALVVASDRYLEQADTRAIIVPATTVRRGWPNHVVLRGPALDLDRDTFAMTEQPRVIARERIVDQAGFVDVATMREVDRWLRDFLAL